jgi:hypothetical protein
MLISDADDDALESSMKDENFHVGVYAPAIVQRVEIGDGV